MERLRKHRTKIIFLMVALLLIIAIFFSAYSYAKYLTSKETGKDGVGIAPLSCNFAVNGSVSGTGTFINAPFLQQVSAGAKPVQMNQYVESEITVNNNGESGAKYGYSFILYSPVIFATNTMFQLVKLDGSKNAVSATELYQINANGTSYSIGPAELESTDEVPNQYRDLIDSGNELKITAHAEDFGQHDGVLSSSYATYYDAVYGEEGSSQQTTIEQLMCSITVKKTQPFDYCRLTINLDVSDDFVLGDKQSHSYLFRCVPRTAFDSEIFLDNEWSLEEYRGADVTVPDNYVCRWDGDKLMIAEKSNNIYHEVKVKTCIGITSPSKINVVFTQAV